MFKNTKKLITIGSIALTLLTTTANAGVLLDFEVGAGSWNAKPSGNIDYGTNIDIQDDLGLNDSNNIYLYADFNHFVPIIPNIRIEQQNLEMDATANLGNITFNNTTYNGSTATKLDLKQQDLLLYWGVPALKLATAGMLRVDFGIDLKKFDGSIVLDSKVNNNTQSETANIDFIIPMGYIGATFDPPLIPASLSASYKTIRYDGSSINDIMAKVSIDLPIPLPLIDIKLDLGYKQQSLVISESVSDNLTADIKFSGMFFGISAKF